MKLCAGRNFKLSTNESLITIILTMKLNVFPDMFIYIYRKFKAYKMNEDKTFPSNTKTFTCFSLLYLLLHHSLQTAYFYEGSG